MLVCILYNFWLTHQAHRGGLLRLDQTTDAYFFATLGRFESNEDIEKLLDNPDRFRGMPQNIREVYRNDFETETAAFTTTTDPINGERSILLDFENQYTPEYFFTIREPNQTWLRASAVFRSVSYEPNMWKMAQFLVTFYDGDAVVKTAKIRVFRLLQANHTKEIYIDVKIPKKRFDRVSVQFWNAGSDQRMLIDDLKVISFR